MADRDVTQKSDMASVTARHTPDGQSQAQQEGQLPLQVPTDPSLRPDLSDRTIGHRDEFPMAPEELARREQQRQLLFPSRQMFPRDVFPSPDVPDSSELLGRLAERQPLLPMESGGAHRGGPTLAARAFSVPGMDRYHVRLNPDSAGMSVGTPEPRPPAFGYLQRPTPTVPPMAKPPPPTTEPAGNRHPPVVEGQHTDPLGSGTRQAPVSAAC